MPSEGERLLTAREVADRLGVETAWVTRKHREGKLPGHRYCGQVRPLRFRWSEVEVAVFGSNGRA
jgi:excisionase family DNA binding protein